MSINLPHGAELCGASRGTSGLGSKWRCPLFALVPSPGHLLTWGLTAMYVHHSPLHQVQYWSSLLSRSSLNLRALLWALLMLWAHFKKQNIFPCQKIPFILSLNSTLVSFHQTIVLEIHCSVGLPLGPSHLREPGGGMCGCTCACVPAAELCGASSWHSLPRPAPVSLGPWHSGCVAASASGVNWRVRPRWHP